MPSQSLLSPSSVAVNINDSTSPTKVDEDDDHDRGGQYDDRAATTGAGGGKALTDMKDMKKKDGSNKNYDDDDDDDDDDDKNNRLKTKAKTLKKKKNTTTTTTKKNRFLHRQRHFFERPCWDGIYCTFPNCKYIHDEPRLIDDDGDRQLVKVMEEEEEKNKNKNNETTQRMEEGASHMVEEESDEKDDDRQQQDFLLNHHHHHDEKMMEKAKTPQQQHQQLMMATTTTTMMMKKTTFHRSCKFGINCTATECRFVHKVPRLIDQHQYQQSEHKTTVASASSTTTVSNRTDGLSEAAAPIEEKDYKEEEEEEEVSRKNTTTTTTTTTTIVVPNNNNNINSNNIKNSDDDNNDDDHERTVESSPNVLQPSSGTDGMKSSTYSDNASDHEKNGLLATSTAVAGAATSSSTKTSKTSNKSSSRPEHMEKTNKENVTNNEEQNLKALLVSTETEDVEEVEQNHYTKNVEKEAASSTVDGRMPVEGQSLREEEEEEEEDNDDDEAERKKRWQVELRRQREVAAKKKAEKKQKKAAKFHEQKKQKQDEDEVRAKFWKDQIEKKCSAVDFVVRLSCAEFCRQHKGCHYGGKPFCRNQVEESGGRDKLLVHAREVVHKLFRDELITAVTITGTNDGRDGSHGTIQYWDVAKSQYCVAVLDTKKTPNSNANNIQKRFFYPSNLVARKDPPPDKKTTKKNRGSMNHQEYKHHHTKVHEIFVEDLVDRYDLDPFPVEKTTIQKWLKSTISSTTNVAVEMDLFLDVVMNDRDVEELERARWEQEMKAEEEAAKKRRAEKKRIEQEEYEECRRQYEEEKNRYKEYWKEHRQASYRETQGGSRAPRGQFYERFFVNFDFGPGGDGFAFDFNDFVDNDYFDSRWEQEMEEQRLVELETHADVLGVSVDSPREVIVRQFRRMALTWHPDRHVGKDTQADAKEKFQEMQNAYDALLSALDEDETD